MKKYKELSSSQQKSAIDHMYKKLSSKEIFRQPGYKIPPAIDKRLKQIQQDIKFCGCLDCFNKYADAASKDNQIKEWVLSVAIDAAEQAFYPEKDDNIIKV